MKTKSLLQTFLTLLALMACLVMKPGMAVAQVQHVPYNVEVLGDILPTGWTATSFQGYSRFGTGHVVLPEFDVANSLLTMDIEIYPINPSPSSSFEIGYVTDVNNMNTFHTIQTFYQSSDWIAWRQKRTTLSGVPANARIAIFFFNTWAVRAVSIYETPEPINLP